MVDQTKATEEEVDFARRLLAAFRVADPGAYISGEGLSDVSIDGNFDLIQIVRQVITGVPTLIVSDWDF